MESINSVVSKSGNILLAVFASVIVFFALTFVQPEQANAVVLTKNYEGTMTIALQETTTPDSGDTEDKSDKEDTTDKEDASDKEDTSGTDEEASDEINDSQTTTPTTGNTTQETASDEVATEKSSSDKVSSQKSSDTQTTKASSSIATTGDDSLALVFVSLAIMLLANCIILVCVYRRQEVEGSVEYAQRRRSKGTAALCLLMTILLGCLGLSIFFTKNTASATGIIDKVSIKSEITVDSTGTMLVNKVTVTNNTSKDLTIQEITCPAEVGSWKCVLAGQKVPAGGNLSAAWSESKVSSGIVGSLRLNGGTRSFDVQAKISFDFDFSVDTSDKTYKGSQWAPSVTAESLLDADNYVVTYGTNEDAGSGTVTVMGAGDFTGEESFSFNILPKTVTVSGLQVAGKTYNGKNDATIDASGMTLDGKAEGDDLGVQVSGEFLDKNAGENKEVKLVVTLTGDDAGNYVLGETEKLTASISKRPVTVTGIFVKDRAYEWKNTDAPLDDTNATIADGDICEGDNLYWFKGLYKKVSYENDKAGDNKKVTLPGGALQGSDHDNYTLSEECKYIYGNILVTLKIYTNCDATVPDQLVHINQKLSKDFESTLPTRKGLKIEGWYSSSECPDDAEHKWDFDNNVVDTSTLSLYANWTTDSSAAAADQVYYWISPSSKYTTSRNIYNQTNSDYVHEDWHIVKSSHEIKEDVAAMKAEAAAGTAGNSGSVTSVYKGYMNGDKYHLYARYPEGEAEPSSNYPGRADGTTSDLNAFVEFRIIEVGQHLNVSGDSTSKDGSILTFMATHTLPSADQLNTDAYTDGGWAITTLRTKLQSGGDLFKRFETGFTNDIASVTKLYNKGGGTSVINMKDTPCGTTSDKFWIPSYVEIYGGGSNEKEDVSNTEGTQYAWFNGKVGLSTAMNPFLEFKTRAGQTAGYSVYGFWKTRSPRTKGEYYDGQEQGAFVWIMVAQYGIASDSKSNFAYYPDGIVPCFCF